MLPKHLLAIKEFQYIQDAVKPELDALREFITLQAKEPIVQTASVEYGLPRWEKSLGINPVSGEEDRRLNIETKLKNNQWLNWRWLGIKLSSYLIPGQSVSYWIDYDKLILNVVFSTNIKKNTGEIYKELRRLIPANLLLKVSTSTVDTSNYYTTTIYREYRKEEL